MKRSFLFSTLALIASGLLAPAHGAVETYKIDPVHSSVGFSIRHFFTRVPGYFTKFSGTIVVDRDHMENSSVTATIDVASVNTRVEMRDNDLRSKHFFDAAKFPTITFRSKTWKRTGPDTFDVTGALAIRDVTKKVVLKVQSLGFGTGARGAKISGWEAKTALDRRDFGITRFPGMLGDDVPVTITVEADLEK